jgi:hypothetical protein
MDCSTSNGWYVASFLGSWWLERTKGESFFNYCDGRSLTTHIKRTPINSWNINITNRHHKPGLGIVIQMPQKLKHSTFSSGCCHR